MLSLVADGKANDFKATAPDWSYNVLHYASDKQNGVDDEALIKKYGQDFIDERNRPVSREFTLTDEQYRVLRPRHPISVAVYIVALTLAAPFMFIASILQGH